MLQASRPPGLGHQTQTTEDLSLTCLSSAMSSQAAKSTVIVFGWSENLLVKENCLFLPSAVVCLHLAGGDLLAGNWAREAGVPQRGKCSAKESKSTNAEVNGVFLRFHYPR